MALAIVTRPMREASNASFGSVLPIEVVKGRLFGQRALVLEEDAETFGRIFMSLAAVDCRATLARRRVQAFQLAERTLPTLVIFSTSLSEARPTELLTELRANAATAGAVLVALAPEDSKRERRRLTELGCDGYLWKPADRYLFAAELLKRTPCLMGGAATTARSAAGAPVLSNVA
jgi:DNA-binding response OmpR family regulator